jgi:hypothetical protein
VEENEIPDETNTGSVAPQPDLMSKLAEENLQTSENKKNVSSTSKRKSIETDFVAKRAKYNNDQAKNLYNSETKLEIFQKSEIKTIAEQMHSSSNLKNTSTKQSNDMQELPGLSISLSQSGRNVEEIKVKTKNDTQLVEEKIILKINEASEICKSSDGSLIACDSQLQELNSFSESPKLEKNTQILKTIPKTTKLRKEQVKANKKTNIVKKEKLHCAEKQLLVNRYAL